ncbi:unnamed protein product [Dicrocoelium dendriticum]|nr:unnamed protein product [Dicrocoelium dendriticum]
MVHWDEYGGHLDRDLFVDADTLGSSEFSEPKQKGHKANQSVHSDLVPVNLLPPSILDCLVSDAYQIDDPSAKTHVITHQLEIPLRCELVFLDYEGRSDGEAMKRIVIGLRPQEMILVGNNHSAIDRLASYCRSVMLLSPELVHTPNNGDVVNCTKEGDIFQARMKDSLVSSLKFTKIRDYELAWVEATLSLEDDQFTKPTFASVDNYGQSEDAEMSEYADEAEAEKVRVPVVTDQLPVLNPPLGPIGSHKTVFVNEPKLSDLKQLLLAQGLVAEFVSGVLVVDNCVAIKRSEAGKLLLEGLLSRTYFDVRQILPLALLARSLLPRIGPFLLRTMKFTFDQIIDDVQLLISRLKAREAAADNLRQQIAEVQAQLSGRLRYQEEMLSFGELSDKLSMHPRGQLILCLAAENKQLEQLQIENRALHNSLDEHQAALELIMNKYRGQMSKMMHANHLEVMLQSKSTQIDQSPSLQPIGTSDTNLVTAELTNDAHVVTSADPSHLPAVPSEVFTERISTLAAIAKDVCDHGDAYTSELEVELQRLRSENEGLREMLMISSTFNSDSVDDQSAPCSYRDLSNTAGGSVRNASETLRDPSRLSNQSSVHNFSECTNFSLTEPHRFHGGTMSNIISSDDEDVPTIADSSDEFAGELDRSP